MFFVFHYNDDAAVEATMAEVTMADCSTQLMQRMITFIV